MKIVFFLLSLSFLTYTFDQAVTKPFTYFFKKCVDLHDQTFQCSHYGQPQTT